MWITLIIIGTVAFGLTILIILAKRKMGSIETVANSPKVANFTDQNFSNKVKSGFVLVDFWASWCIPCKLMTPVLNELADETEGKVSIGKLNVDEAEATASKFSVRSIPTLILFKNGKEIHRFVGVKTKDYLLRELDRRTKF
jgi:thioredoxin 1